MVFYAQEGVSSCDIAGAIARAALEDIRINSFACPGLPEIRVRELGKTKFEISLWLRTDHETLTEEFVLGRQEALAAARGFLDDTLTPEPLLASVQEAMASLERRYREADRRTVRHPSSPFSGSPAA